MVNSYTDKLIRFYRFLLIIFYIITSIYIVAIEFILYGLIEGVTNFEFFEDWATVILILYFSISGLILAFRKTTYIDKPKKNDSYDNLLDSQFALNFAITRNSSKFLLINVMLYGFLLIIYFLIIILFDTILLIELDSPTSWILYPLFILFGLIQIHYSILRFKIEFHK